MDPNLLVFDAAAMLGIGTPSDDPLPDAEPGFITIRVPDGLSLKTLRDSPVGKKMMHGQGWYDRYPWINEAPPAGVYRLRLPVPGSNRKTVAEQATLLSEGETIAPVALVAAVLLCIQLQVGTDPLSGEWTRCAEQTADGSRVELAWSDDRLGVDDGYGDGYRHSLLWASSVRKS